MSESSSCKQEQVHSSVGGTWTVFQINGLGSSHHYDLQRDIYPIYGHKFHPIMAHSKGKDDEALSKNGMHFLIRARIYCQSGKLRTAFGPQLNIGV